MHFSKMALEYATLHIMVPLRGVGIRTCSTMILNWCRWRWGVAREMEWSTEDVDVKDLFMGNLIIAHGLVKYLLNVNLRTVEYLCNF